MNADEAKQWLIDNLTHSLEKYLVTTPISAAPGPDATVTFQIEIYYKIDRRRVKRIIRKLCADC